MNNNPNTVPKRTSPLAALWRALFGSKARSAEPRVSHEGTPSPNSDRPAAVHAGNSASDLPNRFSIVRGDAASGFYYTLCKIGKLGAGDLEYSLHAALSDAERRGSVMKSFEIMIPPQSRYASQFIGGGPKVRHLNRLADDVRQKAGVDFAFELTIGPSL